MATFRSVWEPEKDGQVNPHDHRFSGYLGRLYLELYLEIEDASGDVKPTKVLRLSQIPEGPSEWGSKLRDRSNIGNA